jgi:hypothetical protein
VLFFESDDKGRFDGMGRGVFYNIGEGVAGTPADRLVGRDH